MPSSLIGHGVRCLGGRAGKGGRRYDCNCRRGRCIRLSERIGNAERVRDREIFVGRFFLANCIMIGRIGSVRVELGRGVRQAEILMWEGC